MNNLMESVHKFIEENYDKLEPSRNKLVNATDHIGNNITDMNTLDKMIDFYVERLKYANDEHESKQMWIDAMIVINIKYYPQCSKFDFIQKIINKLYNYTHGNYVINAEQYDTIINAYTSLINNEPIEKTLDIFSDYELGIYGL